MVKKCCVCSSQKSNENDITLHSFPKNQRILKKWILRINKDYIFNPSCHTRICSKHFNDDDFSKTDRLRRLKLGAIPTKMLGFQNSSVDVESGIEVEEALPNVLINENFSDYDLSIQKQIKLSDSSNNSTIDDQENHTVIDRDETSNKTPYSQSSAENLENVRSQREIEIYHIERAILFFNEIARKTKMSANSLEDNAGDKLFHPSTAENLENIVNHIKIKKDTIDEYEHKIEMTIETPKLFCIEESMKTEKSDNSLEGNIGDKLFHPRSICSPSSAKNLENIVNHIKIKKDTIDEYEHKIEMTIETPKLFCNEESIKTEKSDNSLEGNIGDKLFHPRSICSPSSAKNLENIVNHIKIKKDTIDEYEHKIEMTIETPKLFCNEESIKTEKSDNSLEGNIGDKLFHPRSICSPSSAKNLENIVNHIKIKKDTIDEYEHKIEMTIETPKLFCNEESIKTEKSDNSLEGNIGDKLFHPRSICSPSSAKNLENIVNHIKIKKDTIDEYEHKIEMTIETPKLFCNEESIKTEKSDNSLEGNIGDKLFHPRSICSPSSAKNLENIVNHIKIKKDTIDEYEHKIEMTIETPKLFCNEESIKTEKSDNSLEGNIGDKLFHPRSICSPSSAKNLENIVNHIKIKKDTIDEYEHKIEMTIETPKLFCNEESIKTEKSDNSLEGNIGDKLFHPRSICSPSSAKNLENIVNHIKIKKDTIDEYEHKIEMTIETPKLFCNEESIKTEKSDNSLEGNIGDKLFHPRSICSPSSAKNLENIVNHIKIKKDTIDEYEHKIEMTIETPKLFCNEESIKTEKSDNSLEGNIGDKLFHPRSICSPSSAKNLENIVNHIKIKKDTIDEYEHKIEMTIETPKLFCNEESIKTEKSDNSLEGNIGDKLFHPRSICSPSSAKNLENIVNHIKIKKDTIDEYEHKIEMTIETPKLFCNEESIKTEKSDNSLEGNIGDKLFHPRSICSPSSAKNLENIVNHIKIKKDTIDEYEHKIEMTIETPKLFCNEESIKTEKSDNSLEGNIGDKLFHPRSICSPSSAKNLENIVNHIKIKKDTIDEYEHKIEMTIETPKLFCNEESIKTEKSDNSLEGNIGDKLFHPRYVRDISDEKLLIECTVKEESDDKVTKNINSNLIIDTTSKHFSCSICDKNFVLKSNLRKHIVKHLNTKNCQRLTKKITIHTEKKHYNCDETLFQSNKLRELMKIHIGKTYSCEVCSEKFSCSSSLKNHMRAHTEEKSFKCEVCFKSFSSARYLKRHKNIHMEKNLVKCNICSKSFRRLSYLKEHILIHSGKKPYSCEICSKKFSWSRSLNIHIKLHSGDKPFQCEVCLKSFAVSQYLKEHMNIHTGDVKCEICCKSFRRLRYLRQHLPIHSRKNPYKCEFCNESFNKSDTLKTHMRVHTGENHFTCEVCFKSYSSSRCLKRHKNIHMTKNL